MFGACVGDQIDRAGHFASEVILHQEKKSSEFQAMVMGSVTFFGVTSVI